jgi:hypothetical protein
MLSVSEARQRVAVVVPVYFEPSVPQETILPILEGVFRDTEIFCRPDSLLVIVDRRTTVDELFSNAPTGSRLHDIPVHRLEKNRAKAGAINEGLQRLLECSKAEYFVTRDCDGDHILEDIPRMVSLAAEVQEQTGEEVVAVMGARSSLEKPMGWLRQEWELLTNRILVDLASHVIARSGQLIDRRFWNGFAPDIQSGYRVYSRAAAGRTVECLSSLPEKREVLMLACESVPFTDLLIQGGVFAQVRRLTLVEQPVSSYSRLDFGKNYGHLISFLGKRYDIPEQILLRIVDNELVSRSIYFTDYRDQLLLFRNLVAPGAASPQLPGFV